MTLKEEEIKRRKERNRKGSNHRRRKGGKAMCEVEQKEGKVRRKDNYGKGQITKMWRDNEEKKYRREGKESRRQQR